MVYPKKKNFSKKVHTRTCFKPEKSVYVILPKIDLSSFVSRKKGNGRIPLTNAIVEKLTGVSSPNRSEVDVPLVVHTHTQTAFPEQTNQKRIRVKEEPVCPFHSEINISTEGDEQFGDSGVSTCHMCNPSLDENKDDVWNEIRQVEHPEIPLMDVESKTYTIDEEDEYEDRICVERGTQTKPILFPCKFCSSLFPDMLYLRHHSTIHRKMYECVFCPAIFRFKNDLKSHHKTHNVPKTFECVYCSQAFTKRGDIKQHLMKHSQDSLFKCDKCEARFHQKNLLRSHEQSHKEYRFVHYFKNIDAIDKPKQQKAEQIAVAGSEIVKQTEEAVPETSTEVNTTASIAANETQNLKFFFSCGICGLSFRNQQQLKKHNLCHTRKSGKFMCPKCEAKFPTKIGSATHERFAHVPQ